MASRELRFKDATLGLIIEQVKSATAGHQALDIVGGGTKAFLASGSPGETLSLAEHSGIVSYEASELVITAKAGTRLDAIDAALSERGQMLGFEPPHCGSNSTIGGVVACGLSGPARPYRGSARDFVLGIELINGHGEALRFGGQVMKNVAGYDISRLVTGAFGTLGVISEVSLRVVPRPQRDVTLNWALPADQGCRRMLELARQPWPISAMATDGQSLRVRVSGSNEAVADAVARLVPDSVHEQDPFWNALRDFDLAELQSRATHSVWRLSLPPAAPDPEFKVGLHDWGGAQRWLSTDASEESLREYCSVLGGHATCMRRAAGQSMRVFSAPETSLKQLMRRIRDSFDPAKIFNPGRYFEWM